MDTQTDLRTRDVLMWAGGGLATLAGVLIGAGGIA